MAWHIELLALILQPYWLCMLWNLAVNSARVKACHLTSGLAIWLVQPIGCLQIWCKQWPQICLEMVSCASVITISKASPPSSCCLFSFAPGINMGTHLNSAFSLELDILSIPAKLQLIPKPMRINGCCVDSLSLGAVCYAAFFWGSSWPIQIEQCM